jgi:Fe/S biogenesis protein NfuA
MMAHRAPYDYPMEPSASNQIITIDDRALAKLVEVRDRESDADDLGLVIRVTGVGDATFTYEMALTRVDTVAPDDIVQPGAFPVIVAAADVENLVGARLEMSRDLLNPGFVLDNPNSPSPRILGDAPADLSGPVAERVQQVVAEIINPAIASHGGMVEVADVEGETVYVRLSGGCQGCGMATVTLSQGIESTLTELIPEVNKVVDVTDHAAGTDPFYEQAKK